MTAWSNDLTTSLTLPTGATNPNQRITLDGTSDTILVYNSTGALIASVAATAGSDGFGNNYPAGISSTSGVISQSVILLYNGTPALGNLTCSLAASAGTDSFGNAYVAGFGTYNGSVNTDHIDNVSGNARFGNATSSHFLFDVVNSLFKIFDSTNTLAANFNASSGSMTFLDNNGNRMATTFNSPITNTFIGNAIAISPISTPGVPPTQTQINNGALIGLNGTGAALDLLPPQGSAGSSRPLQRLIPITFTDNPRVEFFDVQTTSVVDVTLSGSMINCDVSGNVFSWQVPTPSSGFALGSSASANYQQMQFRYDAEDNLVVEGSMHSTGSFGAGAVTLFVLPAGYRPAKIHATAGIHASSADVTKAAIRVNIDATGSVGIYTTSAIAANDNFYFCVTVPLGNIA